jgi:hypothetical protein
MGGIGSGAWCRVNTKDTTDENLDFDIRVLHRDGSLAPGQIGSYSWTYNGEPSGSIQYRVEHGRIVLVYSYRMNDGEWERIEDPVTLTYTRCNYGGVRPWFICPSSGCGRRVALLYSAGRYFACRHCYDLVYQSQRESAPERAARKSRRIVRRLGGNTEDEYYPDKPKGMHWKTYNRLIAEAQHYGELSWEMYDQFLEHFLYGT